MLWHRLLRKCLYIVKGMDLGVYQYLHDVTNFAPSFNGLYVKYIVSSRVHSWITKRLIFTMEALLFSFRGLLCSCVNFFPIAFSFFMLLII